MVDIGNETINDIADGCIEQDAKFALSIKGNLYCALTERPSACRYLDRTYKLVTDKLCVYACQYQREDTVE